MNRHALIKGLVWDVGLPTVAYYGLRAVGVAPLLALAGGAVVAVLRVAYMAVARHRLDGLAAFVGATFAALLAVSAVTGDPRILLARESIVSGAAGLVLLGSCLVGRPVLYTLVRRINTGKPEMLARLDEQWRTLPPFRRRFVLLSVVWGAGLLAEAVIRLPLIYLLSVDAVEGVSLLLRLGTVGLLVVWSLWYRGRSLHAAAAPTAPAQVAEEHYAR